MTALLDSSDEKQRYTLPESESTPGVLLGVGLDNGATLLDLMENQNEARSDVEPVVQ